MAGMPSLLSRGFPKRARLRKSEEFKEVMASGTHHPSKYTSIALKRVVGGGAKLGITAPKRFGKAHERNRFKRLVREAFRLLEGKFSLSITVAPRKEAKNASMQDIQNELIAVCRDL